MAGPNLRKPAEKRQEGVDRDALSKDNVAIVQEPRELLSNSTANPKYTPRKVSAQVQELGDNSVDLPFHSLIGHTELTPYFWIRPKKRPISPELDFVNPLRKNIKSINLTNTYGKFPTVEFEMYIPEFRQISTTMVVGDTIRKRDPGKIIDYFKLGESFSVKWGYVSNHTEWSSFRVIDRQVKFENGTALLTVKGRIGSRLSATITSDVFSASYGKTTFDQIAGLVDMKVNYRGLLDEEYEQLLKQENTVLFSGANTLAIGAYLEATKADVELYLDPIDNEMRLTTPFKYEMIKRGTKPYKMTYGYPTSNIASIDVETKYPKKKGTGIRKSKPLSQKPSGTAIINRKAGTAQYVQAGVIKYTLNGEEKRFEVGNLTDYNKKSLNDNGDFDSLVGLKSLENGRFPPSDGYKVYFVEQSTNRDYGDYLIVRNISLPTELTLERRSVTNTEYLFLLSQSEQNKLFVSTNNVINDDGLLEVTVYKRNVDSSVNIQEDVKPETDEMVFETTIIEATPKGGDTEEGDELEDKWVSVAGKQTYIDAQHYASNKNNTGLLTSSKVTAFEEQVAELKKEAQAKGEDFRVSKKSLGSTLLYQLEEKTQVKVRTDPSNAKEDDDGGKGSSESASPDASTPAPPFKPIAQQSGAPRRARRLKTTKVRIRLKAGDWTMRVGRIIEIVDIHKSLNGFYYVFSEEHNIGTDGFHTEIECRKASKKAVNSYGKTIRRKDSKKKEKGGTRSAKSGESVDVKNATDKTIVIDVDLREKNRLDAQNKAKEKQKKLEIQKANNNTIERFSNIPEAT